MDAINTQSDEFQGFLQCILQGASLQDIYVDSEHGYALKPDVLLKDEQIYRKQYALAYKEFNRVYAHDRNLVSFLDETLGLQGRKVLDFGCGTGALSVALALKGASVVGADPTRLSLQAAEWRRRYFGVPQDRFSMAQVPSRLPLPFRPGSFEVVVTNSVLEFIPQGRKEYVQSLLSLLQPGGYLVISTENGLFPVDHYTGQTLPRLRRQTAIHRNQPYGLTYFELLAWVKEWSRTQGCPVRNLSQQNRFNSVDKLLRRSSRMQSRGLLSSALRGCNRFLKGAFRMLRLPSDLLFPYATYIFQVARR